MPAPSPPSVPHRGVANLRLRRPGQAARALAVEALTREVFAPFGDVIAAPDGDGVPANGGTARRFDDIARLELTATGGRPMLSWFRVRPCVLPFTCTGLERHPLSSQAFVPMTPCRFLVIAAPAARVPDADRARAFVTVPGQGVNYHAGVWHHPVLALDADTNFLVLGRAGPGADELADFEDGAVLEVGVLPSAGAVTGQ